MGVFHRDQAGAAHATTKAAKPLLYGPPVGLAIALAFALLVPEDSTEEHLQVLSLIAELFSDQDFCSGVRKCRDKDCLLQLLLNRRDVQQIPA